MFYVGELDGCRDAEDWMLASLGFVVAVVIQTGYIITRTPVRYG